MSLFKKYVSNNYKFLTKTVVSNSNHNRRYRCTILFMYGFLYYENRDKN